MAPRAIIFDLLTALLDSWTLWAQAANDLTAAYQWRRRYLELTFGCGIYRPYEELVYEAARDVHLPDRVPETLLRDWDQLRPWPEAPAVLSELKDRGYQLGVVTNCSVALGRRAVAVCAGGVEFDAVVTAEEAGFYKPHGKTYAAILEALGVDASEALFVAGSNGDVVGAAAAGMDVVWHNRVGLSALEGSAPGREGRSLQVVMEYLE
ncbi:hypothetical protein EYZ11_002778 [Aspergillus tanneri]|uniref:Haloacid dehalogenase, type II n=1 Tax=Aspergillus tanneri TaxID=1220188 RepID=A0A4S3JTZ5_9EURO|nr:uncharacterized protein ATNIH1004_008609 [Aspergillus tanneri]KAA8644405.1 hypothetical protein ATNIH1004_008609 [Aspergillus tanneri]THC97731.1 hypothetical protein EYZ11_002778 [Aspergillus tanneri]